MRWNFNEVIRTCVISVMWAGGAWALVDVIKRFDQLWYFLPLAMFYTIVVGDIFSHRIVAHRMFEVDVRSWTYRIFCWLASAEQGMGTVYGLCANHALHHRHSDRDFYDNTNWRYYWYNSTMLSPLPWNSVQTPPDYDQHLAKQQRRSVAMNDSWTLWCDQHQLLIAVVHMVVLALLLPVWLLYVQFLGRLILSLAHGLAASVGHMCNLPGSYRNYDTPDTTSNHLWLHYLFLGLFAGALQNNHHGRPRALYPHSRWFEVDTSLPFVLLLRWLLCVRQHAV